MSQEAIATSHNQQTPRPKVAILLAPIRREQVLSLQAEEQLASFALPVIPEGTQLHSNDLPTLLDGAIACLTGWGTPTLSAELLASYPSLRLVAHTAGSVRNLVPLSALQKGLRISHAAAIIAD
jgi:phosphoglycerate dehydrogenase-like enzyme